MINKLKDIFGIGPKVDYKELIANGAIVLDVRTKGEYISGHVKDSLNIPLELILGLFKSNINLVSKL